MGTLRIILAITVIFDHMTTPSGEIINIIFGSMTAVRIFFMISGFYMSLIFITKYSQCENGKLLFFSNRALRIYPTYLAILIFMAIGDAVTGGGNIFFYSENWEFPNLFFLLSNIFILGLDAINTLQYAGNIKLMPLAIGQAWSLGTELIYYVMVPFIVLNRSLLIGFLFVLSISFRFYIHTNDFNVLWNYLAFPSALVFFLMGHLSYLIYTRIKNYEISRYLGIAGIILVVVYLAQRSFVFGNIFLPFLDPFVHSKQGYIFYPLMTIAIPYLFLLSKDSKIDRTIGNLSFSVYLLGTTITSHIVRLNLQYNDLNWLKHFLVLSITIIVAGCIYKFIEKPIEVLRSKRVEKNINGT